MPYAYRVSNSPLIAVGARDEDGRPWTSVWGGERGFARRVAQGVLGVQSLVDGRWDPVVRGLFPSGGGAKNGNGNGSGSGSGEDDGTVMSALSIDLETRDRVKLAGRMVVGALEPRPGVGGQDGGDGEAKEKGTRIAEAQVAMLVEESLGNCPKYLNKKNIRPHVPSPILVGTEGSSAGLPLPAEAIALLEKADMFFLSSSDGKTMDTNHRGGPPGFVRVVSNTVDEHGGVVLVYPEYSGNRLYQTLGNLRTDPRVGIAVSDFDTSDVLYLTGETELLVGADAARLMPHTKLAVKVMVREARFVKDGLPFRGDEGERSPYNPPVRRLVTESTVAVPGQEAGGNPAMATLIKKEELTQSIMRFTFKLQLERGQHLKLWKAGQHVTLDFSSELDNGWSHMQDSDPQSLNDDFIRTFTISNPPLRKGGDEVVDGTEMQITARRNGPVTGLLWRQNVRVPLEVPILGFGGEDKFRIASNFGEHSKAVFVAGGVGITPVLAQAAEVIASGSAFSLLWALQAKDLGLAIDTFERTPGLASVTQLFATGSWGSSAEGLELIKKVEGLGSRTVTRRIAQEDVLAARDSERGTTYYVCTSPGMLKVVQGWLEGEVVVAESFSY